MLKLLILFGLFLVGVFVVTQVIIPAFSSVPFFWVFHGWGIAFERWRANRRRFDAKQRIEVAEMDAEATDAELRVSGLYNQEELNGFDRKVERGKR